MRKKKLIQKYIKKCNKQKPKTLISMSNHFNSRWQSKRLKNAIKDKTAKNL